MSIFKKIKDFFSGSADEQAPVQLEEEAKPAPVEERREGAWYKDTAEDVWTNIFDDPGDEPEAPGDEPEAPGDEPEAPGESPEFTEWVPADDDYEGWKAEEAMRVNAPCGCTVAGCDECQLCGKFCFPSEMLEEEESDHVVEP